MLAVNTPIQGCTNNQAPPFSSYLLPLSGGITSTRDTQIQRQSGEKHRQHHATHRKRLFLFFLPAQVDIWCNASPSNTFQKRSGAISSCVRDSERRTNQTRSTAKNTASIFSPIDKPCAMLLRLRSGERELRAQSAARERAHGGNGTKTAPLFLRVEHKTGEMEKTQNIMRHFGAL